MLQTIIWCCCRRPAFASYSVPQEREAPEEMRKFHFGKLSVNSLQAATAKREQKVLVERNMCPRTNPVSAGQADSFNSLCKIGGCP